MDTDDVPEGPADELSGSVASVKGPWTEEVRAPLTARGPRPPVRPAHTPAPAPAARGAATPPRRSRAARGHMAMARFDPRALADRRAARAPSARLTLRARARALAGG